MSEPYMPRTDEVREQYANETTSHDPDAWESDRIWNEDAFDRWLADHDRQVAAEALRDAANELPFTTLVRGMFDQPAPVEFQQHYRDWLRARADRLEAGNDES